MKYHFLLLSIKIGKEKNTLETKGGSIQAVAIAKLTLFPDTIEFISGDADGNIVIFTNDQILSTMNTGSPITTLTYYPNISICLIFC